MRWGSNPGADKKTFDEKPQTTELLLSHQLEVVVDTLKLIPGASLILRESEELSEVEQMYSSGQLTEFTNLN